MNDPDSQALEQDPSRRHLVVLPLTAAVAGVAAGFVGGAFRLLLEHLDTWREDLVRWADGAGALAWCVPVVVVACGAALGAATTRWVPLAAGSGIQHVEAVERGEADPPPLRVVPARFVGGLASIGLGGMVLGREGPTVHMAAAIGAATGRLLRAGAEDIRTLQTTLSGAGLAVAFNAPVAGGLFVFEEIRRRVRVVDVLAVLAAVASAVGCMRLVLGDHPDFAVPSVDRPSPAAVPIFVVFGAVVGVCGVAYSRLTVVLLDVVEKMTAVPREIKAAAIGLIVGGVMMIEPLVVGGGDALTQKLLSGHGFALSTVVIFLVVRFVAGPLSYAAATPGGLFAPMLALGALMGLVAGRIVGVFDPALGDQLTPALVLVGLSTLFAAVVQAPFTGIVLVIEMTSITSVTVPMLVSGVGAVTISALLRNPPIYDELRKRMLAGPGGR
ncbi:chloride channel protein [Gordonia sp. ABSL49_1]|uniref:chloride channel protein n=1 Tax=Gordonia sp. ABSL49_1 TaxID=2920941 RepID=UPI001F0E23DD|nr:chloride channel protein [Gordonia sp. ABSL49_1]MCH5641108.1 chloride channel protein [Gordonia sp. ABSL49_1]